MTPAASTLDSVRALAPAIREHADSIEQERRLPEAIVRGLIDAGVFRLLVPRSLGGEESDPMSACRVFEEIATHDGAAGWCAMIGAANGHFGGLLPAEARARSSSTATSCWPGYSGRRGWPRRSMAATE